MRRRDVVSGAAGALEIAWPFDLASGDLMYPLPKWADRK
jgi:hypothetical protein